MARPLLRTAEQRLSSWSAVGCMLLAQLAIAPPTACQSSICVQTPCVQTLRVCKACKSRGHFVTSQLQIVDWQRYACSASLYKTVGFVRLQTRRVCTQIVDLQASNPSICKPHKSEAFVRKPLAANLRFASEATRCTAVGCAAGGCTAKLCKAMGL